MLSKLELLLEELEASGQKGRSSSKSHLKAALYDWRREGQWQNNNAAVINVDDAGYAFLSFTKREPKHCTIRHLFILEKYRGKGYGRKLMNAIKDAVKERDVQRLRFFADIPSVSFYEKLGYKWHGTSKTGLPFYYGDLDSNLINLPNSQARYITHDA